MATTPAYPFLRFDPDGVFLEGTSLDREQLNALYPKLEAARREFLEVHQAPANHDASTSTEKNPLSVGFFELPEQILIEYQQIRHRSDLGRILKVSHRLRETVDRVVLLAMGGPFIAAKALMDACCDPYFNELSRGQRGSRPRMYFEGNSLDNDACQGLLHLLGAGRRLQSIEDRWALLVISSDGSELETAVAFRQLLPALRHAYGNDPRLVSEMVIPVNSKTGNLAELAELLGCQDRFQFPERVPRQFSVFSAAGILPAAVVGLNVVELLTGAKMVNDHFRTAPVDQNIVLNYVGVCHLLRTTRQLPIRVLSIWSKALETLGTWHDQLLGESLGKARQGVTPISTVNTRDRYFRGQQDDGPRDKFVTNVIVESWRCDSLTVGQSELQDDPLNNLTQQTWPQLMSAAVAETNEANRVGGRPTADIRLPQIREATVGQLMQMLMIATAIEGRLLGANPYDNISRAI